MSAPVLTMSKREFERAVLMRRVHEGRLTQAAAATLLGLSQRQTERLYQKYRTAGPSALASRKRGRPSNRRIPGERRNAVLELVRARYSDFGPTLAREKLLECHGVGVSTETLRKWMTEDGLWVPRARSGEPRFSGVDDVVAAASTGLTMASRQPRRSRGASRSEAREAG